MQPHITRAEFVNRIDWRQDTAVILVDGRRKIMLDVEAMGTLRKSLIDTVGHDRARGIFRRFGFACGESDFAQALKESPEASAETLLARGLQEHMLMGHVYVELSDVQLDMALGSIRADGVWRSSFEAERHLQVLGLSPVPVCWTLEGYGSGWASSLLGRRVIAMEKYCVGMGGACCTFSLRTADDWGPRAKTFLDDLADVDLGRRISILEQMAGDLRQTQAKLIGSEAKYRALFENAPDLMMLCDPVTGRILDVNRAVIDRLGHSRETVLSMGLRDVHPAKDQGKISQVIGPTLSEPARSHSMTLVGIDGREFAVEAAFSIVPFAGSTVLQAFYHDVTGYQKAQTALRDAEELAHIGRMASAVAHEIRNPLSAIVSGIRLLTSSERSEPERVLIFETILSESERLDNTLNDFLQFARPRSPRRRPVDVGKMAGDILGIVWSDSGVVGDIVVKLDIPQNLPPVSCDGDQIRQVFWNVILNAVQAMAGKGELIVRLKPSTSALMIIVADSGPGISFEELERVFEPFHTTKPRGTGLGLPIARRIIQGHGGTITIESVPGKGTTVTFSLPLDGVDGQA